MMPQIGFLVWWATSLVFGQTSSQVAPEARSGKPAQGGVALHVRNLQIGEDRFNLRYEIRNDSEQEIWVCDDVDVDSSVDFEIITDLAGYTLLIRLRLGVPLGWWRAAPPIGKYVRLPPGEGHVASLWLDLPVRQQPVFASRSAHHSELQGYADRLVLEVGYFPGDLAARVAAIVRDANEAKQRRDAEDEWFMQEVDKHIGRLGELHRRWEETTCAHEKERLKTEKDRIEDEARRLSDASLSPYPILLYIDSLGGEIPEEVFWIIEDALAKSRHNKSELMIPHGYAEQVEKERFLRATVKSSRVPHLPPRYLDPTQNAPWGKE